MLSQLTRSLSVACALAMLIAPSILTSCNSNSNVYSGKVGKVDSKATSDAAIKTDPQSPADVQKPESNSSNEIYSTTVVGGSSEAVIPPSIVTGALLHCEELPGIAKNESASKVGCSMKEEVSKKNVVLTTQYSKYAWGFKRPEEITVTMKENSVGSAWQVEFDMSARSPLILNRNLKDVSFKIEVQDQSGLKTRFSTHVERPVYWMRLNGGLLPTNATLAGTEQGGRGKLYICRLYADNQIIPGKLMVNYANTQTTVCYANLRGKYYQSNFEDGAATRNYDMDALVLDVGNLDSLVEWVSATNGSIPDLAMVSGLDISGAPQFTCRGLENGEGLALPSYQIPNAAQGENTPGTLAPGSKGCSHQYYGERIKSNYQVLSWKTAYLKEMMDQEALSPDFPIAAR